VAFSGIEKSRFIVSLLNSWEAQEKPENNSAAGLLTGGTDQQGKGPGSTCMYGILAPAG